MINFCDTIIPSYKNLRTYAEKLLIGVTPQTFARKPTINGLAIELNHPAFNYGHLAVYPALLGELIGLDTSSMAVSDAFKNLFKKDTVCQDDPLNSIYPDMRVITETFFNNYDQFIKALPTVNEDVFSKALSGERATRFPTAGTFIAFCLSGHIAVHLGQVSAWRRCMGLKAA